MAVNTHIKISPVGIDLKIQSLQQNLSSVLTTRWTLTDADFYGRVYINKRSDNEGIEAFNSRNEYISVLYNDKIQCNSFFYVNSQTPNEDGIMVADVVNIWQFKTTALKPLIAHRADEEILRDIIKVYEDDYNGFEITDILKDIDDIYSDVDLIETPIYLQPACALRIDSTIFYTDSPCY